MTSKLGKQTIAIHLLPIISRNRVNQKMKFGQLIECAMRRFFLEKSHKIRNKVGRLLPHPFLRNQIQRISGSIV